MVKLPTHICVTRPQWVKWKLFPFYWPFVRGIHRSPMNSLHKGQWHGALMFSLISSSINGWVNNREAGDLRCHCAPYDLTVMCENTVNTMAVDALVHCITKWSAARVVILLDKQGAHFHVNCHLIGWENHIIKTTCPTNIFIFWCKFLYPEWWPLSWSRTHTPIFHEKGFQPPAPS